MMTGFDPAAFGANPAVIAMYESHLVIDAGEDARAEATEGLLAREGERADRGCRGRAPRPGPRRQPCHIGRMGVSIYYTARRVLPLSPDEQAILGRHVREFNDASPTDGEELALWPLDDPSVVLNGSTRLTSEGAAEAARALIHWCAAITELRRAIPDADWRVQVDDADLTWDEAGGYDAGIDEEELALIEAVEDGSWE